MRQIIQWAFVSLGLAASILILFTLVAKILPPSFILIITALCIGMVILGIQILSSNNQVPKIRVMLVTVPVVIVVMSLFIGGGFFYVATHSIH